MADPVSPSVLPEVDRVLKALRLHRAPGWNYPAHYLGIAYDAVGADHAMLSMDPQACTDARGRLLPAAMGVLADVALAAAVRGCAGLEARLATVSAKLSFLDGGGGRPVQANSRRDFLTRGTSITMAGSSVTLTSGGAAVCSGQATFAVLDNRAGIAAHPMPPARDFSRLQSLDVGELTASERDVLRRAEAAAAASLRGEAAFLDHFWGLVPVVRDAGAECDFPCGVHVGNRVGHAQGGVLLGLAVNTSAAALGQGWRLQDIAASFISAGTGSRLRARSEVVHAGRSLACVVCDVTTEDGRPVLRSQSTLAREGGPA